MDPYSQQPQQERQQPVASIDYLNAISAQPQSQTMSPKLLWALIIGGLVLVVVLFFGILALLGSGTSPSERFTAYEYRVMQLNTITGDESKDIKRSDLRALNGSMHTIFVGAQSEAEGLRAQAGVEKYKAPASGSEIATEFTSLTTKLDDARLNNNFDQVYSREMAFQLAAVVAELEAIKEASRSSELREYADTTIANLRPYIDQLNEYNAEA